MSTRIDLSRLNDFFSPDDIEWKPITVSKKTGKGLAAPYITNRAIMDRLDEVCGPENWKNEFIAGPDGGILCGLSIRVGDEWVTKWDGAENTDIEPVKGGLSSAMRRTAVQWGLGRYLYRIPMQWVPVDDRGRFARSPSIPSAFLPPSSSGSSAGTSGDGSTSEATLPPARPRARSQEARSRRQPPRRNKSAQEETNTPTDAPPPKAEAPARKRRSDVDDFLPPDLPF